MGQIMKNSVTPAISSNVVWHRATLTRARREKQNNHRGAIIWFTGITSPYEAPVAAELVLNTGATELDVCARQILAEMAQRGVIPR